MKSSERQQKEIEKEWEDINCCTITSCLLMLNKYKNLPCSSVYTILNHFHEDDKLLCERCVKQLVNLKFHWMECDVKKSKNN